MEVKIIEDSISPRGIRLTTFQTRYWRPIHSEIMTHRDFSRNARSSRAVPVKVLLTEQIYVPQFGYNKSGMQAKDEPVDPATQARWAKEWEQLAEINRAQVKKWGEEGMHKQHANRPLEWFGWIDVLITSTNWANFYGLRLDKTAMPEFQELAHAMREAHNRSKPHSRRPYPQDPWNWHLPYISDEERETIPIPELCRLSTARCARLSYEPFDGEAKFEAEMRRYNLLIESRPVHASPAEHQAYPDDQNFKVWKSEWDHPELHGNLRGWCQYRKTIKGERILDEYGQ